MEKKEMDNSEKEEENYFENFSEEDSEKENNLNEEAREGEKEEVQANYQLGLQKTELPPSSKSFSWNTLVIIASIFVLIIAVYNIFQINSLNGALVSMTPASPPSSPKIELALITANSCPDCFDMEQVVSLLESGGFNVTDKVVLDYSSKTAQALVEKYSLDKVPALIIKGEIGTQLTDALGGGGQERGGAYILPALEPPYIEVSTGQVRGGDLTLIHLYKESCKDCYDLASLIEQLRQRFKVKEYKTISVDEVQGQKLVSKYNISQVPTIIFNEEAGLFPLITSVWSNVGTVESDGFYVMRNLNPPYYDLQQKKVLGFVTMTVLEDKTCSTCYGALTNNKPILESLGLVIKTEKELDISSSEAKELMAKYNITKVPTMILTGDLAVYPQFDRTWKSVGSIESDGAYVFRKVELFQLPYKDLQQGKVITPEKTATTG